MPSIRRVRIPELLPSARPAQVPLLLGDPLTWWRRLPPTALDLVLQKALRATLLARLPPASPLFATARDAAAAAAVGAALAALGAAPTGGEMPPLNDPDTPSALDLGLSLALLCATQGSRACAVVIAHALDKHARSSADLNALCLARAWRRPATNPAGLFAAPVSRR